MDTDIDGEPENIDTGIRMDFMPIQNNVGEKISGFDIVMRDISLTDVT